MTAPVYINRYITAPPKYVNLQTFSITDLFASKRNAIYSNNLITFIITFKPLFQYKKVAFNYSEFAMSTQGFLVYYMIRYNKANRQNLERLKMEERQFSGTLLNFDYFRKKALFHVLVRVLDDAMCT